MVIKQNTVQFKPSWETKIGFTKWVFGEIGGKITMLDCSKTNGTKYSPLSGKKLFWSDFLQQKIKSNNICDRK